MSEAAINRALGWLSTHGKHAAVLVVAADLPPAVPSGMLYSSVAAASNLRRLQLPQQHSLVRLAPVLGQLQQLQYLEAHVALVRKLDGAPSTEEDAHGLGVFVDDTGNHWLDLPDLQQQLCPRLTHFCLLVDASSGGLWFDEQLPQLLPARLQQLELVGPCSHGCRLQSHFLSHLTGLEQLLLQRTDIALDGSHGGLDALERHLAGVQQLCVVNPEGTLTGSEVLQHLAPKLADYSSQLFQLEEGTAARLVRLSRLELGLEAPLSQQTIAAMGALKLQELRVVSSGRNLAVVAQLAAGMPTLCSMQLRGDVGFVGSPMFPGAAVWKEELTAALEQCTQLTSLHLAASYRVTERNRHLLTLSRHFVGVPQQLVELRCLSVPSELLEQQQGAWLAPLTALTRLCLDLPLCVQYQGRLPVPREGEQQDDVPLQALVTEVLQKVQDWPASLQQVEVRVSPELRVTQPVMPRGMRRHKAAAQRELKWISSRITGAKRMCWEHTPEAPAGGRFSVWVERQEGKAAGWGRPLPPCPHLPGVWELQELNC
jgi:hypothetical protein